MAACVHVRAERKKATELARLSAQDAIALLRFLSPANFNSRLTCYSTILGLETLGHYTQLVMENGRIMSIQTDVGKQRGGDWRIDLQTEEYRSILKALDNLASDTSTKFRQSLYDAMILYSRQSQTSEISDRLVFVLAALESILLRNSTEPIQKNLGERMAFLIGETVQERKDIVKTVEEIYLIRSAFVHHGQTPKHVQALERFLLISWRTFARLLGLIDEFRTKDALLGVLEDRKMA